MAACCICIGGINYTMACACNPCGGNGQAMSTTNPNPAICQSICGKDGGASTVGSALNAIGKWGTALTGVLQGKAVATNKSGVAVGAKGATGLGLGGVSQNTMLLIFLVIGVLIFIALRK